MEREKRRIEAEGGEAAIEAEPASIVSQNTEMKDEEEE